MPLLLTLRRRSRALPAALMSAVTVLGLFVLVSATSADAHHPKGAPDVPAPPAVPDRASQIQNIDQVKTAIKGYYGDTLTSTPDPVTGAKMLHTFSATGSYAKEVGRIEGHASDYLDHPRRGHQHSASQRKRAVVFDIDDTTLNTYNYEIYSNFVYDPASNGAFVNAAAFPAVPNMPRLVARAAKDGYTIFFLTGRPESQRPGTTLNLSKVGYPSVPADRLYLKDQANQPWLSSCSPSCTTIQYKSLTRAHIESLGYNIVANFGDQFSDLRGGYADRTFKLPNPMYYLP